MEYPYAGVETRLAGTAFARVRYLPETGSTNEDAATLLGKPEGAGLTIVAEYQGQGAGRKGRTWLARPGSALLFTTILPEPLAAADLWVVPFWVALAVRSALAEFGIEAELHWPNDLLVRGKKLCGILCVSRVVGTQAWAGCGVGMNVHRYPDADTEIQPPPIFCDDIVGAKSFNVKSMIGEELQREHGFIYRAGLLAQILLAFENTRAQLSVPQHVARKWETTSGLPGKRYRLLIDGENEPFDATAISLATGGALVIERYGKRENINFADARALR